MFKKNSNLGLIGTVIEASSDVLSVESGSAVKLATINITPEVWLIRCLAEFRLSDGTGTRVCIAGWGNSEQASQEVCGNANGWTKLEAVDIFPETKDSTASIIVKQTSGKAISCYGRIRAVRIK